MAPIRRVLLVDDDPLVLRALARYFRGRQLEVLTCENANAALGQLGTFGPDAVISDFKMPGLDGLSFLEAVRQRLPAARRCLLTGFADMASSGHTSLGDVTCLAKPWSERALDQFLGGP